MKLAILGMQATLASRSAAPPRVTRLGPLAELPRGFARHRKRAGDWCPATPRKIGGSWIWSCPSWTPMRISCNASSEAGRWVPGVGGHETGRDGERDVRVILDLIHVLPSFCLVTR